VDHPAHDAAHKVALNGHVWHRTGDGAQVDDQGRIWGTGRLRHRLSVGQVHVDPLTLEVLLTMDPSVRRCAVIPDGPDALVALCEAEPGHALDADRLRALLHPHPHGALVRRVVAHPGLPLDTRHAAKIKRGELRAPRSGAS
jgi:acyl-coenzyme A synthetase/AMP-(fatty) acid ligase